MLRIVSSSSVRISRNIIFRSVVLMRGMLLMLDAMQAHFSVSRGCGILPKPDSRTF